MNENIPEPEPNDPPPVSPEHKLPPPNPLPATSPPTEGPGLALCIILGVLLCIVSAALCFAFPPFIVMGLGLALASLFFPGYRGVGLGYFLTIGVALLGTIIFCSMHPLNL